MNKQALFVSVFILLIALCFAIFWSKHKAGKPATDEQLAELETGELTAVLSPEAAHAVAGTLDLPDLAAELPDSTLNALINAKVEGAKAAYRITNNLDPDATASPEQEQQLLELENVVRTQMTRRQEQLRKKHAYYHPENERWKKTLPLHKNNLTFYGPNGEKPLSHHEIDCIPTMWGKNPEELECYEYNYPNEIKSIFFFQEDVLVQRDDLKQGHLTDRYEFNKAPFYTEKIRELLTNAQQGLPREARYYSSKNTAFPQQEISYENDGVLSVLRERDFDKKIQTERVYSSDHLFYSYERSPFSPSQEGTLFAANADFLQIQIVWEPIQDENTPKRYLKTTYRNGQFVRQAGNWLELADHTVLLDNKQQFPAATSFPRAKPYCEIYPTGCKKKL